MNKKVWILNHYASAMFFNKGGRHYWFAKFLKESGYEPVIFGANTRHSNAKQQFYFDDLVLSQEHIADETGVPFVFVKATRYQGNGFNRIKNMVSFYRNVKKAAVKYAREYGKPDVIFASSVHPLTLIAGLQLARRFGVKCICEVRDLWPESIFASTTKPGKNSFLAKILYRGERKIYEKADTLIFTHEGAKDYIVQHRWDKNSGGKIDLSKVWHINNGLDLSAFRENRYKYQINDEDLNNLKLFKVVYTGAIRLANDVGKLVDVAKEIVDPQIKFLIWGDGGEISVLKKRIEEEQIHNIVFKGKVDKTYIPYIVSQADLNVLLFRKLSVILNYGESFNKAFEYFASGKPVLYTLRPNYSIVEKFNCGVIADGSPKEIAREIERIANMTPEERAKITANSEKIANEYDFRNLTKKLIEIIEK